MYNLETIKKNYYLNNLCVQDTAQLENTAIVINSILYMRRLLTTNKFPKEVESSLCRNIIIDSYSAIENVVVCLAYKMQKRCLGCRRQCKYRSSSLWSCESEHENFMKAFANADKFLQATGVIDLTKEAKTFYQEYRDSRNNVHLTRNTEIITKDRRFTIKSCETAIEFMQKLFEVMNSNYQEFTKRHCSFNRT